MRKTKTQIKVLEHEYLKDPNWTRDYIGDLSVRIGLSKAQIYKWHWDQSKLTGG